MTALMDSSYEEENLELPPKPAEPLPSDCCGSGCNPCVYDIYDRELKSWKERCDEIKNGILETKPVAQHSSSLDDSLPFLTREKFSSFVLESIEKLNKDTSIYRFSLPRKESVSFDIGQHLVLRSQVDGRYISRSYTIISPESADGFFEVMIKIYKNGVMSQWIRQWETGDNIDWSGPFGKFIYKQNEYQNISMLAAGTGIAPMLQIIKTVLDNEDDETRLLLIYSCKKLQDILMKDLLDEYMLYWNFRVIYCLTQLDDETGSDRSSMKYGDIVHKRRIDEELLFNELPRASSRCQVLICGTQSFDETMFKLVKNIGYFEENIFKF